MSEGAMMFGMARLPPLAAACLLAGTLSASRAGLGQQTASAEVDRLMHLGSDAMRRGNAADAERYFRQVSQLSPSLPDASLGLGLAELREGKGNDAVRSLTRAIELNPEIPGAHLFLGIALYQQNQIPSAVVALHQEIQLQPKNVEALTWLGIVELGAGHPELAAAPFDQASVLSPGDANLLYYRGRAHTLVAQEAFQALYRLNPDSWQVHHALGESYSASGQPEKAIGEFQAAIAKEPSNADLYESLGNELQKVSRFDDAIKAYGEEVELNPRNGIALYNLGKIQIERGDPATGVPLLRGAAEAHLSPAPTDFYLGLGLAKLGQNEEAARWLELSLKSEPTDFIKQSALYELGRVYQRLNRKEDSEHAVEELKKLKNQSAVAPAS